MGFIFITDLLFISGCNQDNGNRLKINGGELCYTSNVSVDVAKKLGKYLLSIGLFNGDEVTIQVDKSGTTYEVKMPIKPGAENDPKFIELAKYMSRKLSKNVFEGQRVDLHLCGEDLKTILVVNSM
jgi:hypothetical protein